VNRKPEMWSASCCVLRTKPPPEILYFAPIRLLHGPPKVNEHTSVPHYPPISPYKNSKEASAGKAKKQIKNLKTVEEKQYQINRPKHYGWYSYHLNQEWVPYDSCKFLQFATQTRIVQDLPPYYQTSKGERSLKLLNKVAPLVEQAIVNFCDHTEHSFNVENDLVAKRDFHAVNWDAGKTYVRDHKVAKALVSRIHQVVTNALAEDLPHIRECSEDFKARNEAFWFRGGIGPDKKMILKKEGVQRMQKKLREEGHHIIGGDGHIRVSTEEDIMEPYERALQFKGENLIQLRSSNPLPPFVELSDPLVKSSTSTNPLEGVPTSECHDPRVWGFKASTQHGTNIPGYWPQDDNQHGVLFYSAKFNRFQHQAIARDVELTPEKLKEVTDAQALLSCFGWLLPQAVHLGFGPLTELTFPLATQAVLSDGRSWSYYAYQLNTCDLTHSQEGGSGSNNLLWSQPDLNLFTGVEGGKVRGYEPEALEPLIAMLLREPEQREHSLTPYLGDRGLVTDYHDPYQRQFLFDKIRHVSSKRPPHIEKPEVFWWEKVHLIDHQGPLSKQLGLRRRRWFQMYKISHLGKEHWHPEFKSLDEEQHRYIPRAFRERFQTQKGLGRRYSRKAPKLEVPLKEKAAVYELPKHVKYQRPEDDF